MADIKKTAPFERLVTVTLDGAQIDAAKGPAARRLAKEVKVKGFRPGKAPLKVIEGMVGKETLRREAIDDALPPVLTEALTEAELVPVTSPLLEDIRDEGETVEVDVRITLWPTVKKIPKYKGRKVEVTPPQPSDDDVENEIERMRNQFAELEDVDREAFDGDFVIIDLKTSRGDQEVAAGSATDLMYEVGSGTFLEGMDDALRGAGAGRIAEFETTLPPSMVEEGGAEVTARVLVKQVKTKKLPEVTDEWVDDVSEFETVGEMRAELRTQMAAYRMAGARAQMEERLLAELAGDLDLELPETLVEAEMEATLHRFAHRLETQGVTLEQYFQLTGQDQGAFVADLRSQSDLNLRTRILLEALVEEEGLELDDGELDQTITTLAAAAKMSADDYREALSEGGREQSLTGDILRRKAIDLLLDAAVAVDEHGNEVDITGPQDEGAEARSGEDAGAEDTDEEEVSE